MTGVWMEWQPEQLESVACDLCGGFESAPVCRRPDGLTAVACSRCGLCYINPRPKTEHLGGLYDESYFRKDSQSTRIGFDNYLSDESRSAVRARRTEGLRALRKMGVPPPVNCLEIGCATGEFCHLISQQQATVSGLDISAYAIEEARRRYPGIHFRHGDIGILSPSERYDTIFAFDVIEHVPSPSQFLQRLQSHLLPGGTTVLTTANYECAQVTAADHWMGFLMSFEHLYFLAPAILSRMGNQAGLRMIDFYTGGTGRMPVADSRIRSAMRWSLRQARLLALCRCIRKSTRPGSFYRPKGRGHSLLIAFRSS